MFTRQLYITHIKLNLFEIKRTESFFFLIKFKKSYLFFLFIKRISTLKKVKTTKKRNLNREISLVTRLQIVVE